jgi:hypothetical protein
MPPLGSRSLRRIAVLLPLFGPFFGCAASGGPADEGPPLLFVRQRGVWAPEELHRDVAACIDLVHPELAGDAGLWESPPGTARGALRERVVACMDERGWSTGSSAEPEEWEQ